MGKRDGGRLREERKDEREREGGRLSEGGRRKSEMEREGRVRGNTTNRRVEHKCNFVFRPE